jgi:hypothetical protein
MLANIIDSRHNPYISQKLNVVMEPSWHDNSCQGADQYSPDQQIGMVDIQYNISLSDAIKWANQQIGAMTLYLYNSDYDPFSTVSV